MRRCIKSIQQGRQSQKIVQRGWLSKCKMLHSIQYSHWDSNTDHADSEPIETNGKTALDCVSILMAACYIFGASILACQCVSVRVKRLVRTNCSVSFTHHRAAVYYSQEQECNPSIYLSESYDTWFCHLLSLKNTHCMPPLLPTRRLVSNQPGTDVLSATQRSDRNSELENWMHPSALTKM